MRVAFTPACPALCMQCFRCCGDKNEGPVAALAARPPPAAVAVNPHARSAPWPLASSKPLCDTMSAEDLS